MLNLNDWIIINYITYQIASIADFDEMRKELLVELKKLIDFDSASFYTTTSIDDFRLARPIGYNCDKDGMKNYLKTYMEEDYCAGMNSTGRNMAYKESDVLPDNERVLTPYYKNVYLKNNWHFSLHLNIAWQGIFMGIISLFRDKSKPDYEYKDIFILDMIKKHLSFRLYQNLNKIQSGKLSISDLAKIYNLSPRETTIVEKVSSGYTSSEISLQLEISDNTVKKHISNIYNKLNINSQIQLLQMIE